VKHWLDNKLDIQPVKHNKNFFCALIKNGSPNLFGLEFWRLGNPKGKGTCPWVGNYFVGAGAYAPLVGFVCFFWANFHRALSGQLQIGEL